MQLSLPKFKINPLLYANILSWVFLITVNTSLYIILSFGDTGGFLDVEFYLKGVFLNIFLLVCFFYYRYRVEKFKDKSTLDLLTRALYVSLGSILVSLVAEFVIIFLNQSFFSNNFLYINAFYTISVGSVGFFISYNFFIFRILIFRQSPKYFMHIWNGLVYVLFASLIFNFFHISITDFPFFITFVVLLTLSLILSSNMRWVAYLTTREKLQSIGLLTFVMLCTLYYVFLIYSYFAKNVVELDLAYSVYVWALLAFVLLFTIFGMLVTIFNIPTTSVFKKKLEEVLAFQQLTQSLQIGNTESELYKVFLENCIKTANADTGWLEIFDSNGKSIAWVFGGVNPEKNEKVENYLRQKRLEKSETDNAENVSFDETDFLLQFPDYQSVLHNNLIARNNKVGEITLIKEQEEGFNSEHQDLIDAFSRQTSIAIQNYRLVEEALEKERYKQELDIAQKVQKSLLPKAFAQNNDFEVLGFSESAKQVGGDYYDILSLTPERTYMIIGDVSGKGTSAAFNMAQMKGIFQSLIQLDIPLDRFLYYSNEAIARCFEKASFITITILAVDTYHKTFTMARAGHCPTLYFSKKEQKAFFIQDKGMGLGIMRNKNYAKFISMQELPYESGDMMLLYTDGISEAKDSNNEEYGYERIRVFLEQNHHLSLADIQQKFIDEIHHFSHNQVPDDDYTCLWVRFNQ